MATNQSDSCKRAAQAAIEVVREECAGMDVEIRELDSGMFMEIPSVDMEEIERIEDGEISLAEFSSVVDSSGFIRRWLGGIVASDGVEADHNSTTYAARVHTFAESVFDEPLAFSEGDLVGTETLKDIAASG